MNHQSLHDEIIGQLDGRPMEQKHLEKSINAVVEGRVKRHLFLPSGRVLYTVVGKTGDEFIDPTKPFCSCQHFFFSVLGGRDKTCYHLLANVIATKTRRYVQVEFHDEEFRYFLKLLSLDLLSRVDRANHQQTND